MKKFLFILFAILLILPLIFAVEIEMGENYDKEETFTAKVSGNFLEPLTKRNIFLCKKHVCRIPITPEIAKINDDFYIHMQLPGKSPGNYSIELRSTLYRKAGKTSRETIKKNFTISNNLTQFTIEPGFIITDKNFSITVENLQDKEIIIETKTKGNGIKKDSINVGAGRTKKIDFDYIIFNSTFNEIQLISSNTNYTIPVLLPSLLETKNNQTQNETDEEPEEREQIEEGIVFKIQELNVALFTNSNQSESRIIRLYNVGNGSVNNIRLNISNELKPYVNLPIYYINELTGNSNVIINLSIKPINETKTIEGKISARSGDFISGFLTSEVFVKLNYVEKVDVPKDDPIFPNENDSDNVPDENDSIYTFQTCEDMGGTVCQENQNCTDEEVDTPQGNCCLAVCKDTEEKEDGLLRKIIGFGIIIVVAGFLAWFFLVKFRGTKRKKVDFKKIAEVGEEY